jgi:hypothetical protein
MEIGGSRIKADPGKSRSPYLKNKLDIEAHTYSPRYSGGGGRRITVQGHLGQKFEILSKKIG